VKRGTMSFTSFDNLIHRLCPKLRAFAGVKLIGGVETLVASVYFWERDHEWDVHSSFGGNNGGNWAQVCAVTPVRLPERSIRYGGRLIKRGWREALDICARKGYIRIPNEYGGNDRREDGWSRVTSYGRVRDVAAQK
jgi:hypothetical protein